MAEQRRRYYGAIDGLRVICVAFVVLEHIDDRAAIFLGFPSWLGVDLFFLISGFLITTLLLVEEQQTGKIDLWAFYVRRFFRIVPVYSVVLATYYFISMFNAEKWREIVHFTWYYLTFSGEFIKLLPADQQHAPFLVTWTLGIEEKFYLLWPVLFFVFAPRKLRNFLIPVLMLAISPMPAFWFFRSYFGLLMGCALAVFLNSEGFVQLKSFLARIPAVVVLALMAAGFYAVGKDWRFVFLFDAAGLVLLSSLILGKNWMTSFLGSGPMTWLGKRSYSTYLIHGLALNVAFALVHGRSVLMTIIVVLVAMAVASAGAAFLYTFVEEPARKYGKSRLARRNRVPARPAIQPIMLDEPQSSLAEG